MVKGFKIKRHGEEANVQKYLEMIPFEDFKVNDWSHQARQTQIRTSKEFGLKNKRIYEKIKKNPSQYLNFGFSYQDYNLYQFKQFFMRLEREMLKQMTEIAFKHYERNLRNN